MANLKAWLAADGTGLPAISTLADERAELAWRRINDKATSVVFITAAGVSLAAQTVRIDSDSRTTVSKSAAGQAPRRKAIVFGIRGHSTLPDTDMKEGYIFNSDGDRYVVQDIIKTIGEIQGIAEATR